MHATLTYRMYVPVQRWRIQISVRTSQYLFNHTPLINLVSQHLHYELIHKFSFKLSLFQSYLGKSGCTVVPIHRDNTENRSRLSNSRNTGHIYLGQGITDWKLTHTRSFQFKTNGQWVVHNLNERIFLTDRMKSVGAHSNLMLLTHKLDYITLAHIYRLLCASPALSRQVRWRW